MNSPNVKKNSPLSEAQEDNEKDWTKEGTPKDSSPAQPQVTQQIIQKGENYAQYTLPHPMNFKDASRGEILGYNRFESAPRLDLNSRVEPIPRYEATNFRMEPFPRCEMNNRADSLPRLPTIQRFTGSMNDFIQPKKKPRTEDDEFDSNDPAQTFESDDCEAFGKVVAVQLRSMSKMQKFISQRLISEICFRGQFQQLQITSSVNYQTQIQAQAQPSQQSSQPAQFQARPPARYVRSGQEYTYIHPQALRQIIPMSTAMPTDYPNGPQPHPDQQVTNMNSMEAYNN